MSIFGCKVHLAGNASSANANDGGRLRIGDDSNAIRIIALSQSNPLKPEALPTRGSSYESDSLG